MDINLNHIGYATSSIQASTKLFVSLGYSKDGPTIADVNLGVIIQFMISSNGSGSRVELLEDFVDSDIHPIPKVLNQRPGSYHLGYEIDSIQTFARDNGLRRISDCRPAVAFGGRHVCFFIARDGGIVELISRVQGCECQDG
jgi:catechol 2,3-dioxygenase-like lactoylglutathione lyase family enzyme